MVAKKKVLITDGVHELLLDGLKRLGYEIDYHPNIKLQEVRQIVAQYQGMVINSKILVDRQMLDSAINMKFVARLGSGMEIVDLGYAKEKDVAVFSAPEGNRNAVAEHALGMLLSLANNLNRCDHEVKNFYWDREKNRGFEIMGKTIGLIGFGNTGMAFAQKLRGMGMKVLAYDKYKLDTPFPLDFVQAASLSDLKKESDIISFHLPLTDETIDYVDQDFVEECKKGVIFINTSRGKVIPTDILISGLENGSIGGACLDVFENEKPNTFSEKERSKFEQLYRFENVILSPHVAGWTIQSKQRLAEVLLNKIKKHFKID